MGRHQFLLQGYGAHQIQEERLTGPILADDDPEYCTTLPDALDVLQHGLHFPHAADLNQLLSRARHHPGPKGLHDAISIGSSPSAIRTSNFSSAASLTRSRAPSNIISISAAMSLSSARDQACRVSSTRKNAECSASKSNSRDGRSENTGPGSSGLT